MKVEVIDISHLVDLDSCWIFENKVFRCHVANEGTINKMKPGALVFIVDNFHRLIRKKESDIQTKQPLIDCEFSMPLLNDELIEIAVALEDYEWAAEIVKNK